MSRNPCQESAGIYPQRRLNSKAATYDSAGRMGFGKYEFTKFENVPEDYLAWTFDNHDHGVLQNVYPNLWKYLKERGY